MAEPIRPHTSPDPAALAIARRVAAYEIGDPDWANVIVEAYLNPAEATEMLREKMREA